MSILFKQISSLSQKSCSQSTKLVFIKGQVHQVLVGRPHKRSFKNRAALEKEILGIAPNLCSSLNTNVNRGFQEENSRV